MNTLNALQLLLVSVAQLSAAVALHAQVSIVTDGSESQNFNTLAASGTSNSWTNNSTLPNWFWQRSGTGTTYRASNGTDANGGAHSLGPTLSPERAMGSIGASTVSTGNFAWGILLRNNSGVPITDMTVSYIGEQWRNSGAAPQEVRFFYRTSSSPITSLNPGSSAGWTPVNALNFTSPVSGGAASALNGNAPANRVVRSSISLTGLSLAAGDFIMLKWDDPNHPGADHSLAIDDVLVTWVLPVPVYYSRASGSVNDPIWSPTPTGTPGPAIWSSFSSMVVQNGDTVTVNSNTHINDLTTEAASRLLIDNDQLLTVHGDQLTLAQFSISALQGEVELVSPSPVNINVTGTVAFNNLTVNTPAGTTMTGGVNIFGTLLLADGDLNATAATVQLRSDATRTGRLGPVAAGSNFIGDLTVQRYIPGGATNWRLLGSPVAGATVNGWQDDFITAGYPGSQFPNFQDPPGSGNLWPSIRWYDETNTFADVDSGLVGVSSNLQSLAQGQGFAVWCGDNLGGTNPFTIDLTGAPHIASAPIQLPMTFTGTGNPTIDGWNLVSNPVASAVRFSDLARTNVDDYITYYNPAMGNTAVYDISLGFGLNGGTNTIQSGQAFWLKANAASPAVQVEENDKVASNSGGFFGGSEVPQVPGLRLAVSSNLNSFSDETLVIFAEGSPVVDAQDVAKVIMAHPAAPQIGTRGPGNELLAINTYGAYANDIVIPLMVKVGVSGAYTITVSTLAPLGLTCLSLEDLATGTVTPIGEGASYTFTMEADADPDQLRFQLRATAPVPFSSLNATCASAPNGQASVEVAQGPVDITWTDAFGNVLLQQTVDAGTASLGGLQAGSYAVNVSAGGACAQLSMPFTISAPFELEAVASVSDASCPNLEDGLLDLMVLGGTAPFTYAWSNGATTEDLVAGAGVYTVTVTDANGCAWDSDGLTIASAAGPDAEIVPVAGPLLVGQEQLFQAAVVDNVSYAWDLGDGTVAEGPEVVHTYSVPGNYTVTMTVEDGLCMASNTIDITVELSTGISGQDRNVFRAWQMHDQVVVELGLEGDGRAVVDVLDATGQLIMQRTAAASTERIFLPADGLASGIYFIRVTAGRDQRTLRVPVMH